MAIIDDIKAIAKDGADLTAIETGLGELNPLSGITDKDTAWDLIKSNPLMLSAFDSEQGKRAKTVEENLMNGKVQELIKAREEELRKELNPDENPADKVARDFEAFKKEVENEKLAGKLMDDLSLKAKELDFDALKARDYAIYGEKAMEKLESDATWMKKQIEEQVNAQFKNKFSGNKGPAQTKIEPMDLDKRIHEAKAAGNTGEALRLQLIKDKQ